jgi:long-chain acyl-CoA synthetase
MRINDLLERDARSYAERTAVAVVGGGSWSYRELFDRIRRIASGLAARGIRRGDRVALIADNGVSFFDVFLSCAYLGAIAAPVNTKLTATEANYVLGDAEPALIILDGPYASLAGQAGVPVLDVQSNEYYALLKHEVVESSLRSAAETDVAMLLYTSGTTGRPKGVCLSQRALTTNALTLGVAQQLTTDDVFMTTTPLYHAAAGTRVSSMLLDGQTHVVLPQFDIDTFLHAMQHYRVTTTVLVPTQLQRMLDSPTLGDVDLSSLRLLVYGAAPAAQKYVRRAIAELGCDLYQGYGLTEAVTNLTALGPADHRRADEQLLSSCGRPVPGVAISIQGPDGRELPDDEVGEVCVRTDKIMTGYWRNDEATREAIVDGWLRTGDLARYDEAGYLFIAGRSKDMLISGGVNVYPAEIEAVLNSHDSIIDAAVIGIENDEWGEVPVAFIVARPGVRLERSDVAEWAASRLARAKQPRYIAIVNDLPRTTSGKIHKPALRQHLTPDSIIPRSS